MINLSVVLILLLPLVEAFYVPGVSPVEYETGDSVSIKVNSIKSIKTAIPFDYYSLMFCRPQTADGSKIRPDVENFGEILWGDKIKPSKYKASMKINLPCVKLCTTYPKKKRDGTPESRQIKRLKNRIDNEYRGHLILDNLPVSEVFIWEGGKYPFYYRPGYPLGVPANDSQGKPTLIYNHLAFTIKYHQPEKLLGYRIVGFTVVPYSILSTRIDQSCNVDNDDWHPETFPPQPVIDKPEAEMTRALSFSYSVRWEEDKGTPWRSRWDMYLASADSNNAQIHWFSIINSLLIVLLLSGMVAGILLRSLHKDFNRYYDPENEDEAQVEVGWKRVHGDVFRTPKYHKPLSMYVGTGAQLVGMAFVTLIFACAGFLSPANRGGLLTSMLLLFVMMAFVNGYTTARLSKMFHAQEWSTVMLSMTVFPAQIFFVFFCLDIILWSQGASNAVPFLTVFSLFGLWFCVSLPLGFFGAVVGYKLDALQHPMSVIALPRAVPTQPWFMNGALTTIAAGIVPFGCAFIESYFILSSIWLNKFYYVFGFLALVFTILVITCAEISIVTTYFQLCYEDWDWWWRAFLTSGSCGFHFFCYSMYYFSTTLRITKFVSTLLYVGWMFMVSYAVALMCGTVGFLASLIFIRNIYSWLPAID